MRGPSRASDCQRLLAFYRGEGKDDRGRTLEQVLGFDHDELEYTHDYIQWLFPLDVPSGVQPWAPIVDRECQKKFSGDPKLVAALRRSLNTMLDLYGLNLVEEDGSFEIERSEDFADRAEVWLTPGNHNFLRLTRMMTSLNLLGQTEVARALQRCLIGLYREYESVIGAITLSYWRNAIAAKA